MFDILGREPLERRSAEMTEIDTDLQILAFSYSPEEQDHLEALVRERGGQMSIAEAIELMERERTAPPPPNEPTSQKRSRPRRPASP